MNPIHGRRRASRLRRCSGPHPSICARALAIACLVPASAHAGQVSGVNLVEAQSGNQPGLEPENRFGLYDQLSLRYTADELTLGLRFETDRNSEDTYTYEEITQRWAEWSDSRVRVRVGNFYTILGRGLIHRSFDLPGVVLDQPGLRSRYGFSRDVDGVLLEGRHGIVEARAFSGVPNSGEFSPGTEELGLERYSGQESGGQITIAPHHAARAGAAYVRSTPTGSIQRELGSAFLEVDPAALAGSTAFFTPLYVEYATLDAPFDQWLELHTDDEHPHALYASANVIWNRLSLAGEWKDYAGFRLGTNDPPSLVREHGFALLNRLTHVLNAEREVGFQIEAAYTVPSWGTVTVNQSRSDGSNARRFEETYVELYVAPEATPDVEATAFYDRGKDEFVALGEIDVYGVAVTVRPTPRYSVTLDVERLEATRGLGEAARGFRDDHLSLSVGVADLATFSLVWEPTRDPNDQESDEIPVPPGLKRHFVSGTVAFTLADRHDVQLFVGERRGGLACTAGTCYQVLPFEGVELRVVSRFH